MKYCAQHIIWSKPITITCTHGDRTPPQPLGNGEAVKNQTYNPISTPRHYSGNILKRQCVLAHVGCTQTIGSEP